MTKNTIKETSTSSSCSQNIIDHHHLPLHLLRSDTIPPSPTLSNSTIDFLPNFFGYSWIAYGASSLLVITHFPSPLSDHQSRIGPIFRQFFELSSHHSSPVSVVSCHPRCLLTVILLLLLKIVSGFFIMVLLSLKGCDASVMIASPNGDAEKDAKENLSLPGDGFDTVIKAKQAVEAVCPGVVSCADILAIATRDVIGLLGGPSFSVELGRRDGLNSKASNVEANLPKPTFNLNQLNTIFSKHGLSQKDMIALSGAHTVGFSHCDQFTNRLYSSRVDPTLDPTYAQQLMSGCPRNVDPNIVLALDTQTEHTFDNLYYKNLVNGKGLLSSDQVLFTDGASRSTVVEFANDGSKFFDAFVVAIKKLGRVGVKTGKEGEIRRDCSKFN